MVRASIREFRSWPVLKNFGTCREVGRRGGRRNCRLKEPTANERERRDSPTFVRRDNASRSLVVATAPRFSWAFDLRRLFHLGGASGSALSFRQLHLAVLFAGDFRELRACVDQRRAELVADLD